MDGWKYQFNMKNTHALALDGGVVGQGRLHFPHPSEEKQNIPGT